MAGRDTSRSAFTLLEMLVALALVGIIAGSLYTSLHIGFKAHESITTSIEPVRRTELAARLIRRDIESAVSPSGLLAGEFVGQNAVGESGRDADILVLHSSAHVPETDALACDVRRVELTCEPVQTDMDEDETYAIVRRVTTRLLAPETPTPEVEILCRGIYSFNIRYFDGSDWVDSWDSNAQDNALPLAVEINIELEMEERDGTEKPPYAISRVFCIARTGTSEQREQTGMMRGSR